MSLTWLFGPSKVVLDAPQQSSSQSDDAAASSSQCPVDHTTRSKWLQNQKAVGLENVIHPSASPSPAGTSRPSPPGKASSMKLSNERETSSIPRFLSSSSTAKTGEAAATEPQPAPATTSKWVYPSPSQFFTALQRKNREPKQEDMDTVVTIHNAVNERTWQEVMLWEREAGVEGATQLVSFKGRPKDRSPRAWWKVLLGYQPPFDRHDWIVDRDGKRIRYVIDFYTGRGGASASLPAGVPPQLAFYLDVRPALDDFESVKMRVRHGLNKLFGLGTLNNKQQRDTSQ